MGTDAEVDAFYSTEFRVMTTAQRGGLAQLNLIRGSDIATIGNVLPVSQDARFVRINNDTNPAVEISCILIAELFV